MIVVDDVTVTAQGRTLLDRVSLEAPDDSVTGIVGPNGSGKTTLLRALVRAVPLSSGRVLVDGHDLRTRSRRWIARRMAEVAQRSEPDGALSVADEVALGGLAARGVLRAGDSFDRTVATALEAVGLTEHAYDRLVTLSGGELQRVALARALAQGAAHVLLDEPTNHLDIRHRLEIVHLVPQIAPTVVIVLHDLELAASLCDHVVLLDQGRVVHSGPPAEVLHGELLDAVYGVRTTVDTAPGGRIRFSFALAPSVRRPAPPEPPPLPAATPAAAPMKGTR